MDSFRPIGPAARETYLSRRLLAHTLPQAGCGMAAVLSCITLCLISGSTLAHDSSTGWTYPPACCRGDADHGDCQRIPDRTVQVRPGGWVVVLHPGDHNKVTRQDRYFIPFGDEIPSYDNDYHICLHPTEEDENCFFVPPDTM